MHTRTLKSAALLAALLGAAPAHAHEIVRDGNVGALLHIEPDDAPRVGTPNKTWFETNMRGGKPVTLTNCTCTLNVYAGSVKAGAKPLSTPKLRTAGNKLTADLTFPNPAAYTLVLTGKPKGGATFNAFRLTWVIRADGHPTHED